MTGFHLRYRERGRLAIPGTAVTLGAIQADQVEILAARVATVAVTREGGVVRAVIPVETAAAIQVAGLIQVATQEVIVEETLEVIPGQGIQEDGHIPEGTRVATAVATQATLILEEIQAAILEVIPVIQDICIQAATQDIQEDIQGVTVGAHTRPAATRVTVIRPTQVGRFRLQVARPRDRMRRGHTTHKRRTDHGTRKVRTILKGPIDRVMRKAHMAVLPALLAVARISRTSTILFATASTTIRSATALTAARTLLLLVPLREGQASR